MVVSKSEKEMKIKIYLKLQFLYSQNFHFIKAKQSQINYHPLESYFYRIKKLINTYLGN